MELLKIKEVSRLYNLVTEVDIDFLEVMDGIEGLIPVFRELSQMTQSEYAALMVDDTTAKMARDLRSACGKLLPTMETLVTEYDGFSAKEQKVFASLLPDVLVSMAIMMYSALGISEVFEDLAASKGIDLENRNYKNFVLEAAASSISDLHELVSLVGSIMLTFKPYLPEYILSDEEKNELDEAIFKAGLPTDAIATLTPEFVEAVLGGETE